MIGLRNEMFFEPEFEDVSVNPSVLLPGLRKSTQWVIPKPLTWKDKTGFQIKPCSRPTEHDGHLSMRVSRHLVHSLLAFGCSNLR